MSDKLEKSDYAKNYFFINRRFLLFGGLMEPKNPSSILYYSYKLYQIFIYIYTVVICTPSVFMGAIENRDQIPIMIKCFNLALTILMGSAKSLFWFFKGKHMENVMDSIESEEFHYEKLGNFDPGPLTKEAKRTGLKYGLAFFILGQLTLDMLYVPAYSLSFWYLIKNKPITNVTIFQKFPYYTYIPFRHDTPFMYILALTHQCIPFYMFSFSLIGIDTLFMNIMNFVGVQFVILQGAFRTIRLRSLKKIKGLPLTKDGLFNSHELEEKMLCELKKSIKHLQKMIWVCEELERNYTYITLGQVLSTLFILCSSLLQISTTPVFTKQFANEFFYLLAMSFQLILYCWFGNEITLKASDIPQALWKSDWYETRKDYRICMLITMLRMKKSIYLTVGKFSPLTLNTYISILKGSYSYYTVLKNVND